jgi:hypothetical protein
MRTGRNWFRSMMGERLRWILLHKVFIHK